MIEIEGNINKANRDKLLYQERMIKDQTIKIVNLERRVEELEYELGYGEFGEAHQLKRAKAEDAN